jgi:hypothetical protein
MASLKVARPIANTVAGATTLSGIVLNTDYSKKPAAPIT